MLAGNWAKVTIKQAAEAVKLANLSEEAKSLHKEGMLPKGLFDLLFDKNLLVDAIKFLAAALPKRESVWWGLAVSRQALGAKIDPKGMTALTAAERWILLQNEETRRAAEVAAQAAELSNPAGCTAMAAFGSGGSIAPPSAPTVPPPEFYTAHLIAGAIMLSAVLTEPQKASDKQKAFLTLGHEIANGTNRWKEPGK